MINFWLILTGRAFSGALGKWNMAPGKIFYLWSTVRGLLDKFGKRTFPKTHVMEIEGVAYEMRIENSRLKIDDYELENQRIAALISNEPLGAEFNIFEIMDDIIKNKKEDVTREQTLAFMIKDFARWNRQDQKGNALPGDTVLIYSYVVSKNMIQNTVWIDLNFKCHPFTLRYMARHKDAEMRKLAASNPYLDHATMMKLSQDCEYWVSRRVLENPNCPREVYDEIIKGKSGHLIGVMCNADGAPKDLLGQLLDSVVKRYRQNQFDYDVVKTESENLIGLIYNKNVPLSAFERNLDKLPNEVLGRVLEKKKITKSLRREIINHHEERIRENCAQYLVLSREEERKFLRDTFNVKMALAKNANLSNKGYQTLLTSDDNGLIEIARSSWEMKAKGRGAVWMRIMEKFRNLYSDFIQIIFNILEVSLRRLIERTFVTY